MSAPIAYVLLEAPLAPDANTLVDMLRQRHPDRRWDVFAGTTPAKPDGPLTIRCDDHLLVVMSMPAPLPYDEFLWKRASTVWREAPLRANDTRPISSSRRSGLPKRTAENLLRRPSSKRA